MRAPSSTGSIEKVLLRGTLYSNNMVSFSLTQYFADVYDVNVFPRHFNSGRALEVNQLMAKKTKLI